MLKGKRISTKAQMLTSINLLLLDQQGVAHTGRVIVAGGAGLAPSGPLEALSAILARSP